MEPTPPKKESAPATEGKPTTVHPSHCECCSIPAGEGIAAFQQKLTLLKNKKP